MKAHELHSRIEYEMRTNNLGNKEVELSDLEGNIYEITGINYVKDLDVFELTWKVKVG